MPFSRPSGPSSPKAKVRPAIITWSIHALKAAGTPKLYIGTPSTRTSASSISRISRSEAATAASVPASAASAGPKTPVIHSGETNAGVSRARSR
ncbi:hypothetical protein OIE69_14250 [Actinacidiphila glaucinigra]|nr:hypothetical protein [Actinacidiphila glaucinigra]WSD60003.1 hypothetical protein OIE69_14250 [Actinacidiphila glaucinigra]